MTYINENFLNDNFLERAVTCIYSRILFWSTYFIFITFLFVGTFVPVPSCVRIFVWISRQQN